MTSPAASAVVAGSRTNPGPVRHTSPSPRGKPAPNPDMLAAKPATSAATGAPGAAARHATRRPARAAPPRRTRPDAASPAAARPRLGAPSLPARARSARVPGRSRAPHPEARHRDLGAHLLEQHLDGEPDANLAGRRVDEVRDDAH